MMINPANLFVFFDILAFVFASWGLGHIVLMGWMNKAYKTHEHVTPMSLQMAMIVSLCYMVMKAIT